MSGHSKWANIQHRKGEQDKKKGKIFSKLIREITVSARSGDGAKLRLAVDKALENNMSKDTVDRAIKRGMGGEGAANAEEVIYEGYGPAGVAIFVKSITDNRCRTVSEVRHAFTRMGGNLGSSGSVAYLFVEKGEIVFPPGSDENAIMEKAIDLSVDDVVVDEDGSIEVVTSPSQLTAVREALVASGLKPVHAEVMMRPSTKVSVDLETAEKVLRLIETLEDLDDVQTVYSNADISPEILEQLSQRDS